MVNSLSRRRHGATLRATVWCGTEVVTTMQTRNVLSNPPRANNTAQAYARKNCKQKCYKPVWCSDSSKSLRVDPPERASNRHRECGRKPELTWLSSFDWLATVVVPAPMWIMSEYTLLQRVDHKESNATRVTVHYHNAIMIFGQTRVCENVDTPITPDPKDNYYPAEKQRQGSGNGNDVSLHSGPHSTARSMGCHLFGEPVRRPTLQRIASSRSTSDLAHGTAVRARLRCTRRATSTVRWFGWANGTSVI
jgi:hypothetical protein